MIAALILFIIMLNIDIYEFFIKNKYFVNIDKKVIKGLKRKDKKQYNKNYKDLKKELISVIKKDDFGPWDDYSICFLDIQIKYWIKYYTLRYNVYGMEIEEGKKQGYYPLVDEYIPSRLEIAKQLQILLYRYDNFLTGLNDKELLEYEENPNSFPSGLLLNKMKEFRNKYDYVDNEGNLHFDNDKMDADYEKCKREFFEYYYKYSGYMWD